jgi:hypothetical protein
MQSSHVPPFMPCNKVCEVASALGRVMQGSRVGVLLVRLQSVALTSAELTLPSVLIRLGDQVQSTLNNRYSQTSIPGTVRSQYQVQSDLKI